MSQFINIVFDVGIKLKNNIGYMKDTWILIQKNKYMCLLKLTYGQRVFYSGITNFFENPQCTDETKHAYHSHKCRSLL